MSRVTELAGGDAEAVRGEHVQQAAREGDADSMKVIDAFGRWVALGLVNLTNVLDPQCFVLGVVSLWAPIFTLIRLSDGLKNCCISRI